MHLIYTQTRAVASMDAAVAEEGGVERARMRGAGRSALGWRLRVAIGVGEGIVVVASLAVIGVCLLVLWVLVADSQRGEGWTSGLRPVQYYDELEADLLDDYANTFAVAHNSGDTVDSTLEALFYGADVIEVDVVSLDGRLYAAHDSPLMWIGDNVFRGPLLQRIWIASAGAEAIKLDLKENSPEFLDLLLEFLEVRRGQRMVMIASGDIDLLRAVAEREPGVLRIYSPGTGAQLRRLEEDPGVLEVIHGVSLRHGLIDEERAAWLQEHRLLTIAWTVNDLELVNELVLLGVDAITTDNLAIMRLLGNLERNDLGLERSLDRVPAPVPPVGWNGGAPALSDAAAARPDRARTRGRARRRRPTRA